MLFVGVPLFFYSVPEFLGPYDFRKTMFADWLQLHPTPLAAILVGGSITWLYGGYATATPAFATILVERSIERVKRGLLWTSQEPNRGKSRIEARAESSREPSGATRGPTPASSLMPFLPRCRNRRRLSASEAERGGGSAFPAFLLQLNPPPKFGVGVFQK